ncbi:MAG: class I SAM-dependent methyltransferase [Aggregatilineales bacterium]
MPVEYHEQNRLSWNAATEQHHTHRPDLIELYKNGKNNLYAEDMTLLGDLSGKTLLHLQCNDGQDSLSIARFCHADVTGVDISDTAIEFAKQFSSGAEIPATFIRSDIFDYFETCETQFDVIYTSYGAVNWISDIVCWGQGIAKLLKPGGKFVVVEFHPMAMMLDYDYALKWDYMQGEPDESPGVGDYVGDDYEGAFKNPHKAFEFSWGTSEIITSLLSSGLQVTHFEEYPHVNGWQPFPEMRTEEKAGKILHYPPDDKPIIAMMYSIVAIKPE